MTAHFIEPTRDIKDLHAFALDYRRPLYCKGFPFVIFWSEKAACTVVAKWFFLQCGLLEEALRYSGWIHNYEAKVFQKERLDYLGTVLDALKAGVPAIKFVRDPYARALSGYLELHRPTVVHASANWASRVRRQVLNDLAGEGVNIEYTFSFRQYLLWRSLQANDEVDAHIATQYVPRDDYVRMRIINVEERLTAFEMLEAEFGLPVAARNRLDIFASGHHHDKDETQSAADAARTFDLGMPVRREKGFPLARFDKEIARAAGLVELVRLSYESDLTLYGRDDAAVASDENAGYENQLGLDRIDHLRAANQLLEQENAALRRVVDIRAASAAWTRKLVDSRVPVLAAAAEKREIERLRALGFDEAYYLAVNPDVLESGLSALKHFVRHGLREGRVFRLGTKAV